MKYNFTLPNKPIYTVAAFSGNAITKDYYNFLVANINAGIIYKAVCKVEYTQFNIFSYHLISL